MGTDPRSVSDRSVMGTDARFVRPMGPLREYTHASCVRWVRCGNKPTFFASDGSVTGIYPRFLRPMGPLREQTHIFCV
eukprot:1186308-Prorocentrum_minimum.AAC.4